jgi:hypothetical protein
VKGFAGYMVYRDVQNYRYMNNTSFLTFQMQSELLVKSSANLGMFLGLCAFI